MVMVWVANVVMQKATLSGSLGSLPSPHIIPISCQGMPLSPPQSGHPSESLRLLLSYYPWRQLSHSHCLSPSQFPGPHLQTRVAHRMTVEPVSLQESPSPMGTMGVLRVGPKEKPGMQISCSLTPGHIWVPVPLMGMCIEQRGPGAVAWGEGHPERGRVSVGHVEGSPHSTPGTGA